MSSAPLVVENANLRVEVDPASGSINSIRNLDRDLELIDPALIDGVPWRLQLADIAPEVYERRPNLRGVVTGKTEMVLHFMKEVVGGSWTVEFDEFAAAPDASPMHLPSR